LPDDGERVQGITGSPDMISYSLESGKNEDVLLYHDLTHFTCFVDARSETVYSEPKRAEHTVTYVATTQVGGTDAWKAGESTKSSRTSSGQQRYDVQSPVQGGERLMASFYQETQSPDIYSVSKHVESRRSTEMPNLTNNSALGNLPAITEAGQFPNTHSVSMAVESRRSTELSNPTNNSALAKLREIQHLHHKEKESMLDFVQFDYSDYKRSYEGQIEVFQTENRRLLQELSASASQFTLLQIQHSSCSGNLPGTVSDSHEVASIITTVTIVATTITTVTTRIKQWKHTVERKIGRITISIEELEQLLFDLSTASSQLTELQHNYAGESKDFCERDGTVSLRDENNRTIATLTAEVAQWKNANAANEQQITAVRRDSEVLRHDLGSARKEVQTKALLIEERDRTIASLTAKVARLKQSDVTRGPQITTPHRDHFVPFPKTEPLEPYDAQSEELVAIRNELLANKALVEKKDRIIATLTAEVDQRKLADTTNVAKLAAECRDKEKLQRDLAALTSQIADLRQRYGAESKDIVTIRNELQTKTSLLEEKELTITSLTAEVTQAKHEVSANAEQTASARGDLERLRRELSSTSDEFTEIQERSAAQSEELEFVRDELSRLKTLYFSRGSGKLGNSTAAEQMKIALEEKIKQIEELRRDATEATSRYNELQRSHKAQLREVSTVRDELSSQVSQHEGTIASLTAQVEQQKRANTMKTEQIASTLKQVEKLQQDLSTSTSHLVELQSLYDTQSSEFITVRNELQGTIASLAAEVDQWKLTDASKAEEIAATLKQVDDLQGRDAARSRELTSVHNELDGKDDTIASLAAELDQWRRSGATETAQIATTIEEVERLQRDLSDFTSQLAELQGRYEAQSHEFLSVRNELQSRISSGEEKDRTIGTLTSRIEEWERSDATEQLATTHERVEQLQHELTVVQKDIERLRRDLSTASSQNVEYQQLNAELTVQIKRSDADKTEELASARKEVEQLQHNLSTSASQIEGWKRSDATKTEELTVVQKDIERLRRDLSTASSQIVDYQQRNAELTVQIKRSDADKAEELASARKEVEQLQHDLSTSYSRITKFQQSYEAQSAGLISVREQLQVMLSAGGDEDRTGTVATLNARVERLSSELDVLRESTSISISEKARQVYKEIMTEEKDYAAVIKLTATVDEWLRADARRAEELRSNLVTLKEIYVSAPALKQIFQSETIEVQVQKRVEVESTKLKSALAANQSQLDGVQRFVTTADKYADTMIIQMLQKLNAEVQQNTEFMAERILKDFGSRATKLTTEQSSAAQRVSESIGNTLAGCLGGDKRNDVALYLPIAFQAYLTYYLHSIISSWTIKKDRDQFINEIYERLQKSGKKLDFERHQLFC
jgi:chromosome segregation ATPase